jgi:hypothetical protein
MLYKVVKAGAAGDLVLKDPMDNDMGDVYKLRMEAQPHCHHAHLLYNLHANPNS